MQQQVQKSYQQREPMRFCVGRFFFHFFSSNSHVVKSLLMIPFLVREHKPNVLIWAMDFFSAFEKLMDKKIILKIC